MKKNQTLILVIVVAVLAGTYFLSQVDFNDGERKKYDYTFHIEDTSTVHKIYIRDKTPQEVTLVRRADGWYIEEEDRKARPVAVKTLLKTFHSMRLKNFVAESMKPTVLNRLAAYGIEVKVMDNSDKLLRHFFVGPPSMDEMGSYMMNKGGDAPYTVFIPGFNGNLTTRFFADPVQWRKRIIWGYDNLDIHKVRVRYANSPQNSFEVVRDENYKYQLTRLIDNQVFTPDSIQAGLFFATFTNIQYQGAIVPTDGIWEKRDSLKSSAPAFDIYVENYDGEWKSLTAYRVKAAEDTEDDDGNPLDYDPDYLHAFIRSSEGKEEMVLAQYYGLQLALVDIATLVRNF